MVKHISRKPTDIFGWLLVSKLFKHPPTRRTVRLLVGALFVSALYFGFVYPHKASNPYTTAIFWSLFWPFFMIVSLVVAGPAFCGICPHGVIGRWMAKHGNKKPIPTILRHKGIGITILLIAYWLPLYLFPGLLGTPWVASLLFLVLTLAALFFFWRYDGMAYCSYICPIGAVTKAYGKTGMVRLHTYQDACGECKSFACVKACDSRLQPFLFDKKNSMRECTLCMDCADACEAVAFSIVPPGKGLLGTIKDKDNMHTWVYIILLTVITMTMRLHHGLGHSPIKTQLPWYRLGHATEALLPIGMDWVGFYALLTSLAIVAVSVFGGFLIAASILKVPFKNFLHDHSYALAPVMLIGSLSHVGSFFFLHYASTLSNAFYWLIGSSERIAPLATMHDGWVHLFSLFGYLGAFWSLWILYKRMQRIPASLGKRVGAWIVASSVIWIYLGLLMLQMRIMHY